MLAQEQRATPLVGHRHTDGSGEYTLQEVMDDLCGYLDKGKDPPSGMLGRWQAIFGDNPDYSIDLVDQTPMKNNFRNLFS